MRSLATILALFICSSCGFVDNKKFVDKEAKEVPVERIQGGDVVYHQNAKEHCKTEKVEYKVSPRKVDGNILNILPFKKWVTIEKEREVPTFSDVEYIYIQKITMISTNSPFTNIDKIKLSINEGEKPEIAWNDEQLVGKKIELAVNGSVNIKPFIKDGKIQLRSGIKGKTFARDTRVSSVINLLLVKDCE